MKTSRLLNLRFYRRSPNASKRLRRNIRRRIYAETWPRTWRLRYFFAWLKTFILRRSFSILPKIAALLLFITLGACAQTRTVEITGHRAYYSIETMTHVMQRGPRDVPTPETLRLVTVHNPSKEDVIFVCDDDFRLPIRAGTSATFLLDARDVHCDLQNDTLYSPNTGVQ